MLASTADDGLYLWQVYLHPLMGSLLFQWPSTFRAGREVHFHPLVKALLWWLLPIAELALARATPWGFRLRLGLISGEGDSLAMAPAQLGFQAGNLGLEGLHLSL